MKSITIELYENLESLELEDTLKKYELFIADIEDVIKKGRNKKIFWEKFGEEVMQIKENWEIDINLVRMELTKRMWEEVENDL